MDLFSYQFEHCPVYRSFCERRGRTPREVGSWAEIPAVGTSAFKDLELTVLPLSDRSAVFHSSGTTEHRPSRHFHSRETIGVYEESLVKWFQPHLTPDGDRPAFLVLAPRAADVPHSSLAHMFTVVAERFGRDGGLFAGVAEGGSWNVDFETITVPATPIVVCGTAFSFVHWCDYLASVGQRLAFPIGSRAFETGGYKGRSRVVAKVDLHRLIEVRLGISQSHIVSEYGMSELSSQAYDRTAGISAPRTFRFPVWTRARILSPETMREVAEGETGLVSILDLANVGSVQAIQTEDLAVRRADGFELIGRAASSEARGCSLLELRS